MKDSPTDCDLLAKQVEQMAAAALAIENGKFTPDMLNDLSQHPDELGQLVRFLQQTAQRQMTRELHSRRRQPHLLKDIVNDASKDYTVATVDCFQQLQKRMTGSYLDVEKLYQPSLYPSLARFPDESTPTVSTQTLSDAISLDPISLQADERSLSSEMPSLEMPSLERPLDADTSNLLQSRKIVAVQSFRGGTGKSNITSNLAITLAQQGKRVGIIDTDLRSPSLHMIFGLDSASINRTLNDYLWEDCALHECAHNLSSLLSDAAVAAGGAIYIIPASTRLADMTRILQADYDRRKLFDGLQAVTDDLKLDVLLIDAHPGINEETVQAISVCSLLVLVLCPDYQNYRGTSIVIELARSLSVQEIMLVVNKAPSSFDTQEYREQLETIYDVPVADILPFAEEMMYLASSELFSAHYSTPCFDHPLSNHPLTKAIKVISQKIVSS
ncbi:MinD/ParA family protein [cf. Phormidesmis sp. LEGE 11477]|uniref:MinD/ParA family ATP-binding protein n=1 Tax=cf. Phormidesmis sp. LEGE 11477 TaxID=1828680 RepID=UPI0018805D25|nr:MinD/ParA family protein [cf. Phormidesmis sp. LEGE 11477]MBE9062660.1 MinD/ParA family protein [cf. Phormidesmis sp. LEGE 11477]